MKGRDTRFRFDENHRTLKSEITSSNGFIFWFFGLSASGKSTYVNELCSKLLRKKIYTVILDGDDFRSSFSKDLGFSKKDRELNLIRAANIAKSYADNSAIVLCSFISPLREIREKIYPLLGENYSSIEVNTPLEECIKRDPKGLYKKAQNGELENMTGINSPFEGAQKNELKLSELNEDFFIEKIKINKNSYKR